MSEANAPTPETASGPRILIVEATKAGAVDLAAVLRELGHGNCTIAASCDEALARAAETAPDVVFADIHLAHRDDGFDAAHRIALLHKAAVVFLSTHTDEDDLRHALAGSPFGYVAAPFEPPKVGQAMDAALANQARGAATAKELAELVVTDVLTGVQNRRGLQRALRNEWKRCASEGAPLALLMVNLDRFHTFNIHNGHAAGDDCLIELAGAMKAHCIRRRDLVARWNGVEFAALLPATDSPGIRHVGNRIVEAVRDLMAGRNNSPGSPSLTASVGVAVANPEEGGTPEALLEKAGRALNAAKQEGGDRVVGGSAPAPAPPPQFNLATVWNLLLGRRPAADTRGRRGTD